MLESVLADVLTRVLGQYLQGIDRDSVNFGAWSGLIELRGVALRPEALAVLFETLGMELPVTVEAGFIGLLQLVVPWKSIGTTPVQIHMRDVTIIARPVRCDGSDDSQLSIRDRRIKRAKLNTDDAVREASWGVTAQQEAASAGQSSWSSWLVSDQLRATIIENIQIHLNDIIIRFEDPFSDPRTPYTVSIVCESLKAVSANAEWEEAFVERAPDSDTRKLLQVTGFRVNWAPITARGLSSSASHGSPSDAPSAPTALHDDVSHFETPELLRKFLSTAAQADPSLHDAAVKSLINPIDGFMRVRLAASPQLSPSVDFREQHPSVDLDIRFPDVIVELNDVQYACLLQTSVYFARLATRGFRPTMPKARWIWAVDQLLPGLSDRHKRALRFTEAGLKKTREQRDLYIGYRASVLKARRTGVEEPKDIAIAIEKMECNTDFAEILAYRDAADLRVQSEAEKWALAKQKVEASPTGDEGTTTSSFWSMLGYSDTTSSNNTTNSPTTTTARSSQSNEDRVAAVSTNVNRIDKESQEKQSSASKSRKTLTLRAAFLLRNACIRMSEGGYPKDSSPRVELSLREFKVGVLFSSMKDLIVEAVLGTIEAWDLQRNALMVYNRLADFDSTDHFDISDVGSCYPKNVSDAIEGIRSGMNPAKDVLFEETELSEEEDMLDPENSFFNETRGSLSGAAGSREHIHQSTRTQLGRDSSPPPTFRVTEDEFLGNPRYSGSHKHVAAFRYSQAYPDDAKPSTRPVNSLDISVSTLEAVVDGPKGSFLWGLKFWQPKGLAQDPIMAFLGAAAGARIAELRMELETALLANAVPMQLNAVILAPRFIVPSSSDSAPSFVVNMGTLGIITSDRAVSESSTDDQRNLRYSNYILTLDDLGMYFSPSLTSAVSRSSRSPYPYASLSHERMLSTNASNSDTTDVERIIRPFSLRFILQTLRDSTVVQVAHGSRDLSSDVDEPIAKVRIRGSIPDLSLLLTQKAFQHLVVTLRTWGEELRPSSLEDPIPGWKDVSVKQIPAGDITPQLNSLRSPEFTRQSSMNLHDGDRSSRNPTPSTLAAYNVKVVVQSVSVELRESLNVRLVTAVASRLSANLVKRSKTKLHADVTLKSWSVTDGSRGSTAAFRRLLYAGIPSEHETFEKAKTSRVSESISSGDTNFVDVRYTLDFAKNEQEVIVNFLSLHVVCVRETYLKLISFFDRVRRHARKRRESRRAQEPPRDPAKLIIPPISLASEEATSQSHAPAHKKITVVSKFDGFTCQLVASGGVVAVYEMISSRIFYKKERDGLRSANGDFLKLFVRDMTAPLPEHATVVAYEKLGFERLTEGGVKQSPTAMDFPSDGWALQFPCSTEDYFMLSGNFSNIRILFLNRFAEVLRQYFTVLVNRARPIISTMVEEVSADLELAKLPSSGLEDKSKKYGVDLRLRNVLLYIPRHSSSPSEALSFKFAETLIWKEPVSTSWNVELLDLCCSVLYLVPSHSANHQEPFSSNFLVQDKVEVQIESHEVLRDSASLTNSGNVLKVATVSFPTEVQISLSEAQYTVLYFVMTENFAETITGAEIMTQLDLEFVPGNMDFTISTPSAEERSMNSITDDYKGLIPLHSEPGTEDSILAQKVEINIPSLGLEISRGWDVSDRSCKVIGLFVYDISIRLKRCVPKRIIAEIQGTLLSAADLRPNTLSSQKKFVVGLQHSADGSGSLENVSITYDKVGSDPPSLFMFLSNLQLELIPELFRDLSYLAIPGWPFLSTSDFAPEFVYIGRTMTVLLNDTQVFLANDLDEDEGALVFTGEFEAKMEWMRGTGAKIISLRSNQLEISAINNLKLMEASPVPVFQDKEKFVASPFKRTKSPLLYPADSLIEYVGPHVDESGRRLHVSVDAALCMVSASDVPIIKTVLNRVRNIEDSYLSTREWNQPSVGQMSTEPAQAETPKQEHTRRASQTLNFALHIPASRFLVTNDIDGLFVPVLEVRQSGFNVSAHGSSMVQVEGQFSMDLFNSEKGWWEPALEPWSLSASMSKGQSGSRAFVVRSEQRMNINFAPTTVTAVRTVGRAYKKAMARNSRSTFSFNDTSVRREEVRDQRAHRPTVAAFLVNNQLGLSIMLTIPGNNKPKPVPHGVEIEIGAQSENLLSSSTNGPQSRESALRCSISVASFKSHEFSAAQVGKHPVSLIPRKDPSSSHDGRIKTRMDEDTPLPAVWEVEMRNGVPVCTLRSRFQVLNNTKTKLDVVVVPVGKSLSSGTNTAECVALEPGDYHPIPILNSKGSIHVRPTGGAEYEWSTILPSYAWLVKTAHEKKNYDGSASGANKRNVVTSGPMVVCKHVGNEVGFYLKIIPRMSSPTDPKWRGLTPWLDISLSAPIVLKNKLPGKISYRIRQMSNLSRRLPDRGGSAGLDLLSGTIDALSDGHLHFSGESMQSSYVSLAFENTTRSVSEFPTRFGPAVRLDDLESGKTKAIQLSPDSTETTRNTGRRMVFRAGVTSAGNGVSQFNVFAPFWLRNRSDTAIQICSRVNYYAAGTTNITLRERPPHCDPDQYVCFEGPYLSIRLPSLDNQGEHVNGDLSSWWTCPSSLDDLEKPVQFHLPGRSLELDVRPAVGLETSTFIVIIRNSSWIINYTPSLIQWCQQSALDKHGNCPTRLLHHLDPGAFQALHWDSKSAKQAIHLRLADSNGESEWIWSQAVPLNIGHSRELPAKMYRPRTHDQYIARVDSKETCGTARVLVVCAEDRQNPPYRIINRCTDRAVAFWQVGSSERPWLVRAGKTTRYSWDDPLAPKDQRLLSLRILTNQDLAPNSPGARPSKAAQAAPKSLNIDTVAERALEISEAGDPPACIDVSVDGATKVITLYDKGSNHGQIEGRAPVDKGSSQALSSDAPVPIVGLDDFGKGELHTDSDEIYASLSHSDYPKRVGPRRLEQTPMAEQSSAPSGTDAVIFLDSIGISVMDGSPSEIVYVSSSGILLNFESSGNIQSLGLQIRNFQVDNQLSKTPYPVLVWVPNSQAVGLFEEHPQGDNSVSLNAFAVEIHRELTTDDILMIRSFHALIRPFNIHFEEGLVKATLQFVGDAMIKKGKVKAERLNGPDQEYETFGGLGVMDDAERQHREDATSSSRRLYVREFKVNATSVRLTSTGSGAAIAKAAGLGSSARTIVGLLLNVENCDFEFPALGLENVFDSVHHFSILVRQYYLTQIDNQRIKLLASNSLMGNPAALFDAVATGARDFISEPGRAKGSAEFIASVGRGSKSLLTHTVGGIVESVSSIPRAVSSGLEKAVGDNDYLAERERIRGSNLAGFHRGSAAKNPAQGLATGALSFAHGLSSGVTGLIREPVQGARQGGAGGLLKGIGKAVIGGLAKPVAGAIDLVAEPAAGLSRQIVDSDRDNSVVIPVRPPRAFRGKNGRIELFDRRYAVGSWLYKAVELSTGTPLSSELVNWIELSNRPERSEDDADWWTWKIVQRFSRYMPGSKRPPRKSSRSEGPPQMYEVRPEKIRVALVTEEEVVIATLDCKLVTVIPLWRDARYELVSDGDSLLIQQTIVGGDVEAGASGFLGLSGTQSIVAAPWDVATPVRRRKPAIGESVLERVACGSTAARDELRTCITEVTKRHGDALVRHGSKHGAQSSARGQELVTLPGRNASGRTPSSSSITPGDFLISAEGRGDDGGDGSGSPAIAASLGVGSSSSRWRGGGAGREESERDAVERAVRRLAKEGGRGGARVIVANRLPDGWVLQLRDKWVESGHWVGAGVPEVVATRDAKAFELGTSAAGDSGSTGEAAGGVVFQAVRDDDTGACGQVQLDMFCGRDAAASFTTRSGETLAATCERRRGTNGAVVLTVRASDGFGQRRNRNSSSTGEAGNRRRGRSDLSMESSGQGGEGRGGSGSAAAAAAAAAAARPELSEDEKLLEQLVEIGFEIDEAVSALADAGGDLVRAVDILTTRQQRR